MGRAGRCSLGIGVFRKLPGDSNVQPGRRATGPVGETANDQVTQHCVFSITWRTLLLMSLPLLGPTPAGQCLHFQVILALLGTTH